jgi:Bacteriophage Lambda NinG protein
MKKKTVTQLKKKLWSIVAKRIKERDDYICFTSGKKVEGANAHCGHMFPSGSCGAVLRYHPLNLHCQSYFENINQGGNGAVYALNFIEKYGQEKMNKMLQLKNKSIKADTQFYEKLIELYTNNTLEEVENYLHSL